LRVEARSGEEPPCSDATATVAITFSPQGHAEQRRAWVIECRSIPRRIEDHPVTLSGNANEPLAIIEDGS
jgi:hypothetical protein